MPFTDVMYNIVNVMAMGDRHGTLTEMVTFDQSYQIRSDFLGRLYIDNRRVSNRQFS